MGTKDPRIDAYIEKAAPFAKPVLEHFRGLMHRVCPEVKETMKWSHPHFEYKGAVMAGMASFKQHLSIGFWKASLIKDPHNLMSELGDKAAGNFGRITGMKDMPGDTIMADYIREAMRLNEEGVKAPVKRKVTSQKEKDELEVPGYFIDALAAEPKAMEVFERFSYSNKRDYIEWLTEAKTEDTRRKRMATAVEWIAEGKSRHWKYQKK